MVDTDKLLDMARTVGGAAWPMLVHYAFISGLVGTIIGMLFILIGTWTVLIARSTLIALNPSDAIIETPSACVMVVLGVIALVIGLITTGVCLPGMIAPEGAALSDIRHG